VHLDFLQEAESKIDQHSEGIVSEKNIAEEKNCEVVLLAQTVGIAYYVYVQGV